MTLNRSGMDQGWTWTGSGPELDNYLSVKSQTSHPNTVHRIIHDIHPTFESGNLKQRQIGQGNVVKTYPTMKKI